MVLDDVAKGGATPPRCPKYMRNHIDDCLMAISNKAKGQPNVLIKGLRCLSLRYKVMSLKVVLLLLGALKYGRNHRGDCLRGINSCYG